MGSKRKTTRRKQGGGVAITTNANRHDGEVDKRRNSGLLGLPQRLIWENLNFLCIAFFNISKQHLRLSSKEHNECDTFEVRLLSSISWCNS